MLEVFPAASPIGCVFCAVSHIPLGVLVAHLVGHRSSRRGQTTGGGSIPRWSASKAQVVTRRKAMAPAKKKFLTIPDALRHHVSKLSGSKACMPHKSTQPLNV